MSLLEVKRLTKRFGGLVACQEVDLRVEEGEVVGVIGPNGAGKSTLFDCISGYYRIDTGSVFFAGQRIDGLSANRTNHLGVARTFQKLRPFTGMTLLENVMVGALCRTNSVTAARRRAAELIDYVGLAEKADTFAEHLSTGQRKRLELARALATRPRLLLLDEVTGGVDVTAIPGLLALVRRLRTEEALTLVVIEHNMRVIMSLADRIVAMHLGRVIADGTPAEAAANKTVIEAYLGASYARGR